MRYITLSEYLRPWARLGITHFLAEHDTVGSSFEENAPLGDESSSLAYSSKSREVSVPSSQSSFKDTHELHSYTKDEHGISSEQQSSQAGIIETSLHNEKKIPASYLLPPLWETQLAKVSQSLVVWSYPELGLDLNGQAVPERSAALKTLIGKLSLPRGTNTFWPMALPNEQGDLTVDIDAYLFGLEKINPQVVLLLGEKAVSNFSRVVKLRVPYTQQLFEGRLYIFLPDLLYLHSERSSLEKTHLYLKTVFSTLQFTFS